MCICTFLAQIGATAQLFHPSGAEPTPAQVISFMLEISSIRVAAQRTIPRLVLTAVHETFDHVAGRTSRTRQDMPLLCRNVCEGVSPYLSR